MDLVIVVIFGFLKGGQNGSSIPEKCYVTSDE
jgi:hypothetical protein